MTTALPLILAALSADLRAFAPTAAVPFTVHTGTAHGVQPGDLYVVLGVADLESEALFQSDADRATAPTDVLATARVFGRFGPVLVTASAVLDRWLAVPFPVSVPGRDVLRRALAQNVPIPQGDDPDLYGRQCAVRLTTEPASALIPA